MTSKKSISEKTKINDLHSRKPFLRNLEDAVIYAKRACEFSEDEQLSKLLAKASILHCALTVEALANNLIQFINLGAPLGRSVEKMDPLSKIELFAFLLKRKQIDRGSSQIQVFSDLIKLRNDYVHPKIINDELVGVEGKFKVKAKKIRNSIKVSEEPSEWVVGDAKQCVTSLLRAIDILLLDDLELEKKSMSCMFLDSLSMNKQRGPVYPHDVAWAEWAKDSLKCDPKFYSNHILKIID